MCYCYYQSVKVLHDIAQCCEVIAIIASKQQETKHLCLVVPMQVKLIVC